MSTSGKPRRTRAVGARFAVPAERREPLEPEPERADEPSGSSRPVGARFTGAIRRRRPTVEKTAEPRPAPPAAQPAAPPPPPAPSRGEPDEWAPGQWEDAEHASPLVRPYTWTRGRTTSRYDFAIEMLVSTRRPAPATTNLEHRAIAQLCHEPRSVAEVAALSSLPLGTVRVLLGEMAELGVIGVHDTSGAAPTVAVMERVLRGLRRL